MMYRNFFICLFLVFTYGCSDSNNDDGFDLSPVDPPANPVTTANANQPGWLYVQTEATAQMTSDTTLEIPFTREVFGFADRPDRRSAYFTASEFEAFWSEEGANSFTEDPPNAVLTWLNGEEQREAEVIISNATVYSDGVQESLVYEVTVETGQMPDAQMSSVSLFVDSNKNCEPANWKRRAYLAGCDLRDQDLTGADLSGANLQGADLYNTLQFGANLSGADLSGADLRSADLSGANLTGANLRGTDVREMFLDDATLINADLVNAQLTYSSLTNADLTGADLTGADLAYADLSGADLSGANLTRVRLFGANLLGVLLNDTDLTDARFSETTCPDGRVTDLFLASDRCSL